MNSLKQDSPHNPFTLTPPEQHATGQYQTYRELKLRPKTKFLSGVSVSGIVPTTVPHGLGLIPTFYAVKPRGAFAISYSETSAPDAINLYLITSATTLVDIMVVYYPKDYSR